MVTQEFINECKNPAYKNRLGKAQIGNKLLYLTVQESKLKVSDSLKISSEPLNEDKFTGYLSEISINDSCYTNGSIIGTTNSKISTIKIMDTRDVSNESFIPSVGVKYLDLTTEWLNLGKYITQSQTIDKTANTSEIKGQDILYKLDQEYVCGINDWTNVTVKDLLDDLCTTLDLELGTEHFINEDLPVVGNNYQKNCKFRDVLSDICEVACSWAEYTDDKLWLKWFDEEVTETLDKSQYSTLEKNGVYGVVNCLVIKDSTFEGENVTIPDIESIEANGETQIAIIDNQLLNTEQLRRQAINSIWERVHNFTYVDCRIVSYYGKPYLKRGNKISVEDVDGTYFTTYVLQHNFKYDGTFYSEISSPALPKEETKIKNTNLSPKQRLMNAEAQVLKAKATIRMVVEETIPNMEDNLEENYYSKTVVNELIEDTERGLTNKYSVGGGNNLLRNTGLYFETSTDKYSSGFEFWTGSVKRVTNMSSKSKTSMYLQNGLLSQRQEVPNDIYTISFQYNRLNALANATVTINDSVYTLDESGTFNEVIDIRSSDIRIEFNCDTIDGYEIYELMCNFGRVALQYTQNANETKTDTVEISEGIKITSDTTDSVFRANADGIRIENKNGDSTTEFLDSGTRTNMITAKQGIIADLLIEKVDGQVWIVGI